MEETRTADSIEEEIIPILTAIKNIKDDEISFTIGVFGLKRDIQVFRRDVFDRLTSGVEPERTKNQHTGTWCYEAKKDGIKFLFLSDEAVENEA